MQAGEQDRRSCLTLAASVDTKAPGRVLQVHGDQAGTTRPQETQKRLQGKNILVLLF